MNMSRLPFFLLIKIFAVGLAGYSILLGRLTVGTVVFCPHFVTGGIDVTRGTFYEMIFYWLEMPVLIATPVMLVVSWSVFHFFGKKA